MPSFVTRNGVGAYIRGLGTSLPQHALSQDAACEHAIKCNQATPSKTKVLERLYKRTEISKRSIVLQTSASEGIENFYPYLDNPRETSGSSHVVPSTAERMQRYEQSVVPLAFAAADAALQDSGIDPLLIRQLVTVSCTGFFAPGFDVALFEKLSLDRRVGRTHLGFMGCHGSLNALRIASAFCTAQLSPVLICAAEICSLHFQYGWDSDYILANSLFADGAAAIVLSSQTGENSWRVAACDSYVIPDSSEVMTWTIGDTGFAMTLSTRVVDLIHLHLRHWLEGWLGEHSLSIADVQSWVIHPGGPRILDAVQEVLCLSDLSMGASRSVLTECGNMSSPTVLFILQKLFEQEQQAPCVMIAFGPGLTIEATLLLSSEE